VWVEDDAIRAERSGRDPATTNNRMELAALIAAYELLPADAAVTMYSDSQICVKTVNEWAAGWERRGWRRKGGRSRTSSRCSACGRSPRRTRTSAALDPRARRLEVERVRRRALERLHARARDGPYQEDENDRPHRLARNGLRAQQALLRAERSRHSGYKLIMEFADSVAGFGAEARPTSGSRPARRRRSTSRSARRTARPSMPSTARRSPPAGRDNGAPGLRPEYHPNYYGAFVLDPDGNNVEAVCHQP
jgi:ribonuclease HI